MKMEQKLIFKTMNLMEVKQIAVKWAENEGWNPGLQDAEIFFNTDPNGFIIATLGREPVGCISAVSYGKTFGFIGFYLVSPQYRGKGYGWQTWQKGMEYLGERTIGLDGVVSQQENYKKTGFKLAYRNIRYEWKVSESSMSEGANIVLASDAEFEKIRQYDSTLFPAERTEFLTNWLSQRDAVSLVSFDSNGNINGYGVMRRCCSGWKIGPLFADNAVIADSLLRSLAAKIPQTPDYVNAVYFDVPEVNAAAVGVAKKYSMRPIFETARMYKGKFPEVDLNKIYGVTTFELG